MLSNDQNILVRPNLPESWLTNKLSLDSQSAFTAPPHSVPKVSNVSAIFAICRGQQELQTSHYNNFSCCRNQALHWIFSQHLNLNCSYISLQRIDNTERSNVFKHITFSRHFDTLLAFIYFSCFLACCIFARLQYFQLIFFSKKETEVDSPRSRSSLSFCWAETSADYLGQDAMCFFHSRNV